jgi:transketolase
MLEKTKLFPSGSVPSALCAEILREPKNGPDVVLIAKREQSDILVKAGDMLSVQGTTARLVVIDDMSAFENLNAAQRERFLPDGKPYVRVDDTEATPRTVMQAALETLKP